MPIVELDTLQKQIQDLFGSVGVPESDAALVADALLFAERSGQTAHGLMRVKPYISRIRSGLTNPTPHLSMETVGTGMLRIDGDHALGQVAAMYALERCMESAAKGGICCAALGHTNHIGMAGYYTKLAAEKGFFAFLCTNASATMAPFGGLDPMLGTNPLALSFPAGSYCDFTLDIATTATARGKVRLCQKEGRPIPQGWAMDPEGNDTTNPDLALAGSMLPMAGHKGYGLAMAVEYLSAIVTDSDLSYESETMFSATRAANTGCFMTVIDISRFGAGLNQRTETWFDHLKSSRLRPGVEEIRIPGERTNQKMKQPVKSIAVSEKIWQEILSCEV